MSESHPPRITQVAAQPKFSDKGETCTFGLQLEDSTTQYFTANADDLRMIAMTLQSYHWGCTVKQKIAAGEDPNRETGRSVNVPAIIDVSATAVAGTGGIVLRMKDVDRQNETPLFFPQVSAYKLVREVRAALEGKRGV